MHFRHVLFSCIFVALATTLSAQELTIYKKFDALEQRIKNGGDTTFVVNFWATWCKPCVAELPYFEAYHTEQQDKKVKVLLVSLDFKSQIEKRVKPFLAKHTMKAEVALLADQNANTWIPKVDADWDGAIPATWVVKEGKSSFKQVEFHSDQEVAEFVEY